MGAQPRGSGRRGRVLSGIAAGIGCVLFLGGFALAAVLYRPFTVPTGSMAPTVTPGDRVLALRIDGADVRRGDVVVFRDDTWGEVPMMKRVVGVGGDEVACCDARDRLLVNGEPIAEPYLTSAFGISSTGFDVVVPDGELFLLGDDRAESLDSRSHITDTEAGTVPRDAVTARVEATAWPPGRIGTLAPATGFAGLPGGVSGRGPLVPLLWAVVTGAVLIVAGAAYGPVARWAARRKGRHGVPAAPVAHNEGTHG
ncbi:signal peptidase I [Streptomyces sp. RFCAC02]|uniref:signal peptidase I n=1 Tax=Streptomyces sp. RFCAC02 TaxID=2499143 RepID=UPI001021CD26|nr:signal peptidase I [Streptomyces sp. RFCAC02]